MFESKVKLKNQFNLSENEWVVKYLNKLNSSDLIIFNKIIKLINHYYPTDAKNKFGILLKEYLIEVAKIIEQLDLSNDAIFATFCCYIPTYLPNTWKEKLKNIAGEKIVKLVEGIDEVQKLTDFINNSSIIINPEEQEKQAEAMRKMLIAMVNDIRVVIIKLSLRATTLKFFNKTDTKDPLKLKLAKETLDIFSPLANRLGIWQLKWQLEDLGFRLYNNKEYRKIAKLLDEKREERLNYIENFNKILKSEINKMGIKCEIVGRPKHIYSIYKKMQKKKVSFTNLYDIRAVRVLVNSVYECYSVLGIVHSLWKPISGEFDDYISHPKNNDYRSLHTVVIGPKYKGVEIQIRTFKMHKFAEYGVAAHWKYKEGYKNSINSSYERKISWLRQLLELRESNQFKKKDLATAFKTELFKDTIYTLTPQGKVIPLPFGSTAIDFAYALHTDIGNRCKGARVNGKIVPLSKPLKNGQRVEIITYKIDNPSINWIHEGWVKSPKAISKIKSFIRKKNTESNKDSIINNGKAIFEKEIEKLNYKPNIQEILKKLKIDKIEDLFLNIAYGDIPLKTLSKTIKDSISIKENINSDNIIKESKVNKKNNILINGEPGILNNLAKCCKPVPPDEIIGYITKGKGVSIHRKNCLSFKRLTNNNPNKVIEATWLNNNSNDDNVFFPIDILIKAKDRQGLIRDISEIFVKNKINVTNITFNNKNLIATLRITVNIKNSQILTKIIKSISQLKDIIEIFRI